MVGKVIVGLTGRIGIGKTTVSNHLEKRGFQRVQYNGLVNIRRVVDNAHNGLVVIDHVDQYDEYLTIKNMGGIVILLDKWDNSRSTSPILSHYVHDYLINVEKLDERGVYRRVLNVIKCSGCIDLHYGIRLL